MNDKFRVLVLADGPSGINRGLLRVKMLDCSLTATTL
jgi:hypothetical protein